MEKTRQEGGGGINLTTQLQMWVIKQGINNTINMLYTKF